MVEDANNHPGNFTNIFYNVLENLHPALHISSNNQYWKASFCHKTKWSPFLVCCYQAQNCIQWIKTSQSTDWAIRPGVASKPYHRLPSIYHYIAALVINLIHCMFVLLSFSIKHEHFCNSRYFWVTPARAWRRLDYLSMTGVELLSLKSSSGEIWDWITTNNNFDCFSGLLCSDLTAPDWRIVKFNTGGRDPGVWLWLLSCHLPLP